MSRGIRNASWQISDRALSLTLAASACAEAQTIHSAKKVFALPSPIQPSEKPPSGHHLYLSLDPKFDGENDFEGLILCGDGLGRRIYESSRAWIRWLRLVTDLRPVLSHP